MGKSCTIHCIGLGQEQPDGSRQAYYAMNRLEIMQQTVKARKYDNNEIAYWYSQTRTGDKVLGNNDEYSVGGTVDANTIPKAKNVVPCEVCEGAGCYICNDSGITKKGHYKNWQDWQIADIKKGLLEKASKLIKETA